MGRLRVMTTAATAFAVIAGPCVTVEARADEPSDWGINGTYAVSSNGQWAQTNDRYEDEAVIRSTWKISTSCTSPVDCTGTVTSDQGWSAPIYTGSGLTWYVKRTLKGWEPCPDGTASDGLQTLRLYPVDPATGLVSNHDTSMLAGEDRTVGISGACGINKWLNIKMPLTAIKIS